MRVDSEEICKLVCMQAKNIWNYSFESKIEKYIFKALDRCNICFQDLKNEKMRTEFCQYHSVQYSVFLYYLSRGLYLDNYIKDADIIYLINKNLNCVEWFYGVNLPPHFSAEHPIKSVLGKAQYGDYLFVYQGTTVGGNRGGEGKLIYPVLGHHIIMYANSTIIGDCTIGNNVIFSANSYVINTNIPDNCIVFGRGDNIKIIKKPEREILNRINCFWNISAINND